MQAPWDCTWLSFGHGQKGVQACGPWKTPLPAHPAGTNELTGTYMSEDLLTAQEAARRLGISTASLYTWLAESDAGTFMIRGQCATIAYLQGGPKGQGRIKIEAGEIERLKDLMRVRPHPPRQRSSPVQQAAYPGITVKLGRPTD